MIRGGGRMVAHGTTMITVGEITGVPVSGDKRSDVKPDWSILGVRVGAQ